MMEMDVQGFARLKKIINVKITNKVSHNVLILNNQDFIFNLKKKKIKNNMFHCYLLNKLSIRFKINILNIYK